MPSVCFGSNDRLDLPICVRREGFQTYRHVILGRQEGDRDDRRRSHGHADPTKASYHTALWVAVVIGVVAFATSLILKPRPALSV
jgi:hypothetical protein